LNTLQIKEQICDICHKIWQQGWVAANDGNVSVKLPDGTFWITPSGVSKCFITPEMLIRINADMEVLEGPADKKPSSEAKMHMRCYEKRPDVGSVVHAHPPTATGFAVAGIPLDDYSMIETIISLGAIPIAPYGTPSTYEVPDAIEPYLAQHDAILLQNHGALTVGCDLITAYYRMETLELFAKISLNAHLLGGAKELGRPEIDKLLNLRENYYHVTGRHPGYEKCAPVGEQKHSEEEV
jgi:L-fuculose-phosphate aldolase